MFALLPYRNIASSKGRHWETTIRSISVVIAVYVGSTTSMAIVRGTPLVEIVAFHSIIFGILAAIIFHRH